MIKPFLIIQLRPEDAASDNEFDAILAAAEINVSDVERYRAELKGLPKVDLNQYSGIIVGGSPYDITTHQDKKSDSQLKVEEDFKILLDSVVKNDFPFLGACSGAGQLANYFRAPVTKKYGEPISGVDMTLTNEGIRDPILAGLPNKFRVLVGHKEACEVLPEQAVLLGSSETCPIQMFKTGENVYATQFHPEADKDVFLLRIQIYKNAGYFTPKEEQDLIDAISKEDISHPKTILKNFAKRYLR